MLAHLRSFILAIIVSVGFCPAAGAQADLLSGFLSKVTPDVLNAEATAFGPRHPDVPAVEIRGKEGRLGWAFLTSDFVSTTGYSGKPIHTIVGIDLDAVLTGAKLVKHSEPIVLVGIPESKITATIDAFTGLDLKREAEMGGTGHDLDIVSGATVTIIVIDDSIVRSGLKVARALGLGGLAPPQRPDIIEVIDTTFTQSHTWASLTSSGSVTSFSLDAGQVNEAFIATGDEAAIARPEKGAPADTFIDLNMALISVPAIGLNLLGPDEYANLTKEMADGEQALLLMGRGAYSFKGSGYVRGGLFDRIQLIQGDLGIRFSDKEHRRLGRLAVAGAPSFSEIDIFRIPAKTDFDPTKPFRLQLLVQRAVGPVKKSFITFDLNYAVPAAYKRVHAETVAAAPSAEIDNSSESAAKAALWKRIWEDRAVDVIVLLTMLFVLTATFFFQIYVTRSAKFVFWFRIGFLTLTLVYLGWYANAQLSIVNLMALAGSLQSGFSWDAFLLDPMTFILWFSVAAALLFWGRGAYCGWLCPFGALQELTNRLAKLARIPQWDLPWGLHERLWAVKYLIFLGLFGVSLGSLPLAETYAEVEPFKTAIVLKFQRSWPFVTYVVVLLGIGLFVERFYCRYLCPLGAALAVPARLRNFNWLHRYRECGTRCQTCEHECMVKAIHSTGEINPAECLYCLHCQVLYQDTTKCPVCIKRSRRDQRQDGAPVRPTSAASGPSR
jgi:NosR/NirI family nitrous oxide reductase transcriptional regulator